MLHIETNVVEIVTQEIFADEMMAQIYNRKLQEVQSCQCTANLQAAVTFEISFLTCENMVCIKR